MKKNLAIVLALVFVLSVAGTAFAAPNPFVDVPAKHWAYDSINTLVKNKVIDGFGDGTYRGDKTLTRYEVAVIVAKAMAKSDKMNAESKAAVDKLQVEFAAELQNLGVRVEKLEKNASSVKITGDARIRFQRNHGTQVPNVNGAINEGRFQERIRLNLSADINENLKFTGRVVADSDNSNLITNGNQTRRSTTSSLFYDQAYITYKNGGFALDAGRMTPTLGQGLIWDGSRLDGFLASYSFDKVSLAYGVADLSPNNNGAAGATQNAALANLSAKVGDNVNVTLAYANTFNKNVLPLKLFAYGANAKIGEFTLTAEGIRNSAADEFLPADPQRTGWWTKLQYKGLDGKPGSFAIYAEYMKLGNVAIDSTGWGHTLNVAGGDGLGMDGAKGFGFGVQYQMAKNANFEANYYSLKPYDSARAGFDKYKPVYTIATNFKF